MNNSSLVSIITPAFNAARTIRQTIDSVLAQTYGNWELIVVDDASTDDTTDIVTRYAATDRRIRLIRLAANSGAPGRAKNAALAAVRGEFIAFLDADDLWVPEKLATQVSCLVSGDADLCYAGGWYVDETLNPCGEFFPAVGEGWLFNRLLKQYDINNQTVVIRRSALSALEEPRFKPEIVIGEDCELFMRIARNGKLLALPDRLAVYRVRPDSVSASRLEHSHEGLAEVIRWVSADAALAERCRAGLRLARAKVCFYLAKAAMARGDRVAARRLMFPAVFAGWRFAILAVATLYPPFWRICLQFGRR